MINRTVHLSHWPRPWIGILVAFHLAVLGGYAVGFLNLVETRQLSPTGIETHLWGSDENAWGVGPLIPRKSLRELIITTHNHVLGLSSIFLIVGMVFMMTPSVPSRWRAIVAVEPFISLLLTFLFLWLTRFFHPGFAYLVLLSGILMHGAFLFMVLANLVVLFRRLTV